MPVETHNPISNGSHHQVSMLLISIILSFGHPRGGLKTPVGKTGIKLFWRGVDNK